jgi:hypothetical protein
MTAIRDLERDSEKALEAGAFPGQWDLVSQARAAHVERLQKTLSFVKGLSLIDYFEEFGVQINPEQCKGVLGRDLPEGAHAQWAAPSKPYSIRLTYQDPARGCTIETHVNLDWSPR